MQQAVAVTERMALQPIRMERVRKRVVSHEAVTEPEPVMAEEERSVQRTALVVRLHSLSVHPIQPVCIARSAVV